MPDAWITLSLKATIWIVSAIISIATLETAFFGIVGVIAWVVFLSGIGAFFVSLLNGG